MPENKKTADPRRSISIAGGQRLSVPSSKSAPPSSTPPTASEADQGIPGGWQLFKRSWQVFKALWKDFVKLSLIVAIPVLVLVAVLILYAVLQFNMNNAGANTAEDMAIINIVLGAIGIISILAILVMAILVSIATLFLLKHFEEKQEYTIKLLLKEAWHNFWSYILVAILSALVIIGGFILLFVPSLIFYIWFGFSLFVLVFEGLKGRAALKRSRQLVKHYGWTIFARFMYFQVVLMVVGIPGYVFQYIYYNYEISSSMVLAMFIVAIVIIVYSIVSGFILATMRFIYHYCMYYDLKNIKGRNPEAQSGMSGGKKFGLVMLAILLGIVMLVISMLTSETGLSNSPFAMAARDTDRMMDQEKIMLNLEYYYAANEEYPTTLTDMAGLAEEDIFDPGVNLMYLYNRSSDGQNFSFCQYYETRGDLEEPVMYCYDNSGEEQKISIDEFDMLGNMVDTP